MVKMTFVYLAVAVFVLLEQVNARPEPVALALTRITRTRNTKAAGVKDEMNTPVEVVTEAKNPLPVLVAELPTSESPAVLALLKDVTNVKVQPVQSEVELPTKIHESVSAADLKNVNTVALPTEESRESVPSPSTPKEVVNVIVKNHGDKTVVDSNKKKTKSRSEVRRHIVEVDLDVLVDALTDILFERKLIDDGVIAHDDYFDHFYYDF